MKKLIIILIICQSIGLAAQIEQDKINHLGAGTMIGFTTTAFAWDLWQQKELSFLTGVGITYLAAHLKEDYDMKHGGFYNNQDIKFTLIGGIAGSLITRLILIPTVPRKKVPMEWQYLYDDENTMKRK